MDMDFEQVCAINEEHKHIIESVEFAELALRDATEDLKNVKEYLAAFVQAHKKHLLPPSP